MRPTKLLFAIAIISALLVVYAIVCPIYIDSEPESKVTGKASNIRYKFFKRDSLTSHVKKSLPLPVAWVTVYHPTIAECGSNRNITFFGDTGKIGCGAASMDMFYKFLDHGDTIVILEGNMKGKYEVTDMGPGGKLMFELWRPPGDTMKGCYQSKFKIIKKKSHYEL